jgi:hypothetical protein
MKPVAFLVLPVLTLAACNEFQTDPNSPRPSRALHIPTETNSPLGEMNNTSRQALPLVTVEGGNTKEDPARVRTIVDDIATGTQPPIRPTTPTTPPPPTPSGVINRPDPITGPRE